MSTGLLLIVWALASVLLPAAASHAAEAAVVYKNAS